MNGIYDHPRCLVQKERILGEASRRNIPRIPTSNNDRKDGGELGETRAVSRRQKWLQFGTGRFHAQ